jgi:hypothetical protein
LLQITQIYHDIQRFIYFFQIFYFFIAAKPVRPHF